jgi:hypothetical protein
MSNPKRVGPKHRVFVKSGDVTDAPYGGAILPASMTSRASFLDQKRPRKRVFGTLISETTCSEEILAEAPKSIPDWRMSYKTNVF